MYRVTSNKNKNSIHIAGTINITFYVLYNFVKFFAFIALHFLIKISNDMQNVNFLVFNMI